MKIRAHFDGRVIVPDEPIELSEGELLEVEVHRVENGENTVPLHSGTAAEALQRRVAAYHHFRDRKIEGTAISDESLRRENLYRDRI